ncbi:MAG TPA: beta-propeller domain-containing protein [Nocardioides sp.]|nr:beta-propeller domain-containing protein [Nocardioides sp.]
MTDLENLWDDLPVGPAPTDAILRAAHRVELQQQAADDTAAADVRRARRRRLVGRPLLAAGAFTGLAAAFVVGANVGGGGPGTHAGGAGQPAPAAFQADLKPAASCDQLLASYVQRGVRLVGAYGWQSPYRDPFRRGIVVDDLGGMVKRVYGSARIPQSSSLHASLDAPRTTGQNSSATGTNVQEHGVDEPDTVKTDGKVLAQVHDSELWLYDVAGKQVTRLSSMPVDAVADPQLLLAGSTLVVLGGDADAQHPADATRVLTVDISDPHNPKQTHDIAYAAALDSARQHGTSIRLVLDNGLPRLGFVHPHRGLGYEEATRRNRAIVRRSTIGDWVPSVADDGGASRQLIDCTSIAIPNTQVGLDTVGIVGFDASTPTDVDAIGLAGATDIAYESTDNLYLVASPTSYLPCEMCDLPLGTRLDELVAPRPRGLTTGGTSYVFDFALNGDRAVHVASGEVEGRIDDRWSMDEVRGVLRVAVSPTSETGPFNSILTLRKLGQDLVPLGRIDHLGRDEDIKSVRWFDSLAILVTYREMDPMYAVDLSRPAHPHLLDRLRLPGYSSYLHPLGPKRMIGVGTGPDGGTQIGLFYTGHLRVLGRADETRFRGTDPLAAQDPRAFTWVPQSRTILTVLERWGASRVGYLAVVRIRHARLEPHLLQVEYGDDVAQVRAVPLGDGRVVLVTGNGARFLPLTE